MNYTLRISLTSMGVGLITTGLSAMGIGFYERNGIVFAEGLAGFAMGYSLIQSISQSISTSELRNKISELEKKLGIEDS